nr:uncharacterized protein LOC123745599 isoform X2 [Procambarus clarkii]
MATQLPLRMPDKISEDEKNSFRLIKMSQCTARNVMYTIFQWGTMQSPGQTLEDYLLNTKGLTKVRYRSIFDISQRQKMTSKAMESTFDITHLFKAICHACDKINLTNSEKMKQKNSLENLVVSIKNFRNEISHCILGITKEKMLEETDKLLDLLETALNVAGVIYTRDPSETSKKVDEVREDIKNIRDQALAQSDIQQYENDLLNEKLKMKLKEEGSKELKKRYENWSLINPVSFLEGQRMIMKVSTVFTQIEVETARDKAKGSIVSYENILELCRYNPSTESWNLNNAPEIFLIEGPAGAGKTTLAKLIKSEWSSGSSSIKGLYNYDLLLYMECRSFSLSSFSQLLNHLLPVTNARYFKEGDLQKYVMDLKTLVIVDGLDELNESSEKLFMDILNQRLYNFVVICTSRSEKVPYFETHVPPEYCIAHLKIIGIAENKREEFIRKYHDEMLRQRLSTRNTEDIIAYVKKSKACFHNHFRLPLNLVVLVWLWADDPVQLNLVTTASELYIETHNLMKKKLIERLARNELTSRVVTEELHKKVELFLSSMYHEALVALRWDSNEKFLPESLTRIRATCIANNLHLTETLSAFLVVKIVHGKEQASVPHKFLHEFYASLWIVQNLFDKNTIRENDAFLQKLASLLEEQKAGSAVQQNILSDAMQRLGQTITPQKPGAIQAIFKDLHSDNPTSLSMSKYRNVLLQVAGVLYTQYSAKIEECTGQDIVQLLHESGLGNTDDNEWFELFELVKNDCVIIKYASKHICDSITITDCRVEASLKLLGETKPKEIRVFIDSNQRNIAQFPDLLEMIAECRCQVNLYFQYDFQHSATSASNDQELKTLVQKYCTLFACVKCGSFLGA